MGMLTPALIRNDALGDIEKDKSFIKRLINACIKREKTSVSADSFCNAVESMGTQHADVPRLFVVKGNTMVELNPFTSNKEQFNCDFYKECAKFAKQEVNMWLKTSKETPNE